MTAESEKLTYNGRFWCQTTCVLTPIQRYRSSHLHLQSAHVKIRELLRNFNIICDDIGTKKLDIEIRLKISEISLKFHLYKRRKMWCRSSSFVAPLLRQNIRIIKQWRLIVDYDLFRLYIICDVTFLRKSNFQWIFHDISVKFRWKLTFFVDSTLEKTSSCEFTWSSSYQNDVYRLSI